MSESNIPKESAIVETPTTEMTQTTPDTPSETQKVQQETEALLEAIQKMVQAELQAAGEYTRESYVKAVQDVRTKVENFRLIDKEQIDASFNEMETNAEQNLQGIVGDLKELGDRLVNAINAAWKELTTPSDSDS